MPKKRTLRLRRAKEAKQAAERGEMPEVQIQPEAINKTQSVQAEAAPDCSSFEGIRQELSPIFCKRELEPPDDEATDTFATQDSLPGTPPNSKAASVSLSRSPSVVTLASSEEHLLLMEAGTDKRGPSVLHKSASSDLAYSVDTYNVAHNAVASTMHSIMTREQPCPAVLKNESYLDACSTVFPNAMAKYEVVLSHANCAPSRELNQPVNKNSWFTTEALNDVAGALGLDRNRTLPSAAHRDDPLHCVECDQTGRSHSTHPASSSAKHHSELALPRENAWVQREYSGQLSSHARLSPNQTQDKNPAIPSTAEDASCLSPPNAQTPPFTAQNDLQHSRSSNLVWPFPVSPSEPTLSPIPLSANHWLPKQAQEDFSFPTTVGSTDPILVGSDQYQLPPHVANPTDFFRVAENKLRQPQLPACSGTPQSITMTRTALRAPLPHALHHTTAPYKTQKQPPGHPATNLLTAPTRVGESNPQHARHQTATPVVQSTENPEVARVMSALTEYRFRNRRLRDTLFEDMLSLIKSLDDCERVRPQAYAAASPSHAAQQAPGATLPYPPFRATLWQNVTQQQTGYIAPYPRMEQPGYWYTDPPLEDYSGVHPQAYTAVTPSHATQVEPETTMPHLPFRAVVPQQFLQEQASYTTPYMQMAPPCYRNTDTRTFQSQLQHQEAVLPQQTTRAHTVSQVMTALNEYRSREETLSETLFECMSSFVSSLKLCGRVHFAETPKPNKNEYSRTRRTHREGEYQHSVYNQEKPAWDHQSYKIEAVATSPGAMTLSIQEKDSPAAARGCDALESAMESLHIRPASRQLRNEGERALGSPESLQSLASHGATCGQGSNYEVLGSWRRNQQTKEGSVSWFDRH